ncbi:MAG: dockerin type I domain-containing protein, partial [Planctomycetota bacterium]|nr:dockerin type I domain-containing protein [Planctomycetota bacterium]
RFASRRPGHQPATAMAGTMRALAANVVKGAKDGFERRLQLNGVADEDDIANGTSLDCNENGIPDECENLADMDGDGKVDVDDLLFLLGEWGREDSPADLNCDGIVDTADLLYLLGAWPPFVPCPWDFNGDGVVDDLDVQIVVDHWGDCPDPPEECPWDLNEDGAVDFQDVSIVEDHFGNCP